MPGTKAPPVFKPGKRPPIGTRRPAIAATPGLAPAPVQIPYSWLQPVLRTRVDKPYTTAAVTRGSSNAVAYAQDDAALQEYGDNPFTATLYTACDADPANLASWTLDYFATQPADVPRTRFLALRICLSKRTEEEKFLLLQSVAVGVRISIYNHPATWPVGLSEQVVEGIHHIIAAPRDMELITSPVIGADHGQAGPWFRIGVSSWGGTDVIAF